MTEWYCRPSGEIQEMLRECVTSREDIRSLRRSVRNVSVCGVEQAKIVECWRVYSLVKTG